MYKVGDKFELKKDDFLFEILGIYPAGQGNQKEAEFDVLINGERMRVNERLINCIFSLKEIPQEVIEEEPKSTKKEVKKK
jgi:hypothetical protein